jgi:hypothetical protein
MSNPIPGNNPADLPPASTDNPPEICPPYYLGLYQIELCFGGHEEGGWWYTWQDHKESRIIPAGSFEQQEAAETAARAGLAETALDLGLTLPGDGIRSYRSASPQQDAIISIEDKPGEDQSTERPRYE